MKFGIMPINKGVASPDRMIANAQLAEAAGIESVWTFEHVIIPVDYESKYPYSRSGRMAAEPETPYFDPLIALTAIAAETKTIRLGTGVNILSQVNPLLMAKQVASLDALSNGRVMLGLGIGWLREEFAAMGAPFERRGARFDDYVAAMRKVWSGDVVEHESDFLSWHGFKSYPKPVQDPLPIHIGGTKGKVFERTAKLGNGWYAPGGSPEKLADQFGSLKAACAEAGRDFRAIEITTMWDLKGGLDSVKKLEDAGAHRLNVPILSMAPDGPDDLIKQLGDEVIAKL